jgi:hypothetical protein
MRRLLLAVPLLVVACSPPPPVKTASGLMLASATIEERFPVNPDVKETKVAGEDLQRLVALLDKHGIVDLMGKGYVPRDAVVESGSVAVVLHPVGQPDRRVSAKSCAQPKLCAFFEEAKGQGLVAHVPVTCKGNTSPCAE